jgi:large subunit ribosomal protein L2
MPVKSYRPLTPSTRYITIASYDEITKRKPEKSLVYTRKKTGGRNSYGRVTSRGRGQGHKQKVRTVDFRRNKHGVEAKVVAIEYDPIRTARLALLEYKDGEKRYIIAPVGLQVGATLNSGPTAPPDLGNALPLKVVPIGATIHNLELTPGRGGQMVRSAGGGATLMSRDEGYAQVRLPSGEIRRIHEDCLATIGQVGNTEHENVILGKAGRARHRGLRPLSRGVAKNPVDHPMGGGAGKTSGGGHPVTPWGVITKGFKTRPKFKFSNRFIVVRRDGRPPKVK